MPCAEFRPVIHTFEWFKTVFFVRRTFTAPFLAKSCRKKTRVLISSQTFQAGNVDRTNC
jgi:hypothetical protein